jgi:hypothetical protein
MPTLRVENRSLSTVRCFSVTQEFLLAGKS